MNFAHYCDARRRPALRAVIKGVPGV